MQINSSFALFLFKFSKFIFYHCCPIKINSNESETKIPIVGLETIKLDSKMPNFEPKSQYLGHEKPQRGDLASITSNWFIGGLLFKFACPNTDYQLLTSRFLRFSVLSDSNNFLSRIRELENFRHTPLRKTYDANGIYKNL